MILGSDVRYLTKSRIFRAETPRDYNTNIFLAFEYFLITFNRDMRGDKRRARRVFKISSRVNFLPGGILARGGETSPIVRPFA